MSKKTIGITVNWRPGEHYVHTDLDCSYIDAIVGAGHVPLMIPNVQPALAKEYIDQIDGLIISGGADISPFIFHEDPHPKCGEYSTERDSMETALYFAAREKKMPILGICRGHQLINAIEGGTVIQDMSLVEDAFVLHTDEEKPFSLEHLCRFEKGSILYEIFGEGEHIVNTHHHQCVGRIAEGFWPTAFSRDGVIEGMESRDTLVLGVQFHPERLIHREKFLEIIAWVAQRSEK